MRLTSILLALGILCAFLFKGASSANEPTLARRVLLIGLQSALVPDLSVANTALRDALGRETGLRIATFSWRSREHAQELGGTEFFPPVISTTATTLENADQGAEIGSLLRAKSDALRDIDAENLGYIPGFSAISFDVIVSSSVQTTESAEQDADPRLLPPGLTSIRKIASGDKEFIIATFQDAKSQVAATGAISSPSLQQIHWAKSTIKPARFLGNVSTFWLPKYLASPTPEGGLLLEQGYEVGSLLVKERISFAVAAQANYYDPGCCWDKSHPAKPLPNAALAVYSSGLPIYEGVGLESDE